METTREPDWSVPVDELEWSGKWMALKYIIVGAKLYKFIIHTKRVVACVLLRS